MNPEFNPGNINRYQFLTMDCYPTDPEEQERRSTLLGQDEIYAQLLEGYHHAASEEQRLERGFRVRERRWEIFTDPDPDKLIVR